MPLHTYVRSHNLHRMLTALKTRRAQQPASDYFHVGELLLSLRCEGEPERKVHL